MSKVTFKIGDVVVPNLSLSKATSDFSLFEIPRLCINDIISDNVRTYLKCYYFVQGVYTLITVDSETVFLLEE